MLLCVLKFYNNTCEATLHQFLVSAAMLTHLRKLVQSSMLHAHMHTHNMHTQRVRTHTHTHKHTLHSPLSTLSIGAHNTHRNPTQIQHHHVSLHHPLHWKPLLFATSSHPSRLPSPTCRCDQMKGQQCSVDTHGIVVLSFLPHLVVLSNLP